MGIDALIIADIGDPSLSGSNPLRLSLEGRLATLPVIYNYLENNGVIIPPIRHNIESSWSSSVRLNGIHLYSCLSHHGLHAELVDNFYSDMDLFSEFLQENPSAIIISTTFIIRKPALKKLVDDIRKLAPDALIIAGGPFVYASYLLFRKTADPDYLTEPAKNDYLFLSIDEEPHIDLYIVSPAGESVLIDALKKLRNGKSLQDLPNTAVLERNTYVFRNRIDEKLDDSHRRIDWDRLPDRLFRSKVMPLQASTGCPYQCAFCNFVKERQVTHIKPLDTLVSEMKALMRRGIKYVRFVDDNFRLGSKNLDEVCRVFIDSGIDLRWMSFIRASALKEADMELLYSAGCVEVQLGLESAHQSILDNMNKKADARLYSKVIGDALSEGINCSCSFIFGFPGETSDTASTTIQFIEELGDFQGKGIFSWSVYPFILAPLSPVYESAMRQKYRISGYGMEWVHRTMDHEEAKNWIKKAFFRIESAGLHMSEENLDLLLGLPYEKRRKFYALRHNIAKLAALGKADKKLITEGFGSILSGQ